MSNEKAQPKLPDEAVEQEVLGLYKSRDAQHRVVDVDLLKRSIEAGITPETMRYGIMRDVKRGVVKSTQGDAYYFNYAPGKEFRLVKADTPTKLWDANRMMRTCHLGCDLHRSMPDDDAEELDKAPPPPGGGGGGEGGSLPPAAIEEEDNIAAQHDLMTDRHPGGVGGTTPDRPEIGRQWHPDEQEAQVPVQKGPMWSYKELLEGMRDNLQKSMPAAIMQERKPSPKEAQFMQEEMGRSPGDIAEGNTYMSPSQRKHFNMWLNKGLSKSMNSLETWLERSRG